MRACAVCRCGAHCDADLATMCRNEGYSDDAYAYSAAPLARGLFHLASACRNRRRNEEEQKAVKWGPGSVRWRRLAGNSSRTQSSKPTLPTKMQQTLATIVCRALFATPSPALRNAACEMNLADGNPIPRAKILGVCSAQQGQASGAPGYSYAPLPCLPSTTLATNAHHLGSSQSTCWPDQQIALRRTHALYRRVVIIW